tara:strand:- start:232 stop:540 length:309 start_codon:yes stop_codon:yes gene_type:complete
LSIQTGCATGRPAAHLESHSGGLWKNEAKGTGTLEPVTVREDWNQPQMPDFFNVPALYSPPHHLQSLADKCDLVPESIRGNDCSRTKMSATLLRKLTGSNTG